MCFNKMNLLIYIFLINFCYFSQANPIDTKKEETPIYPPCLNLDKYKSIKFETTEKSVNSLTKIYEIISKENKRSDLTTKDPTLQTNTFIAYNGNSYAIHYVLEDKTKTCRHIDNDNVDEHLLLNKLKLAWKLKEEDDKQQNKENKKLQFIGDTPCGSSIDCNVWEFKIENETFRLFILPSKNPNEKSELKKITREKTVDDKKIEYTYDIDQLEFDINISDKEFKIDDDVKCE